MLRWLRLLLPAAIIAGAIPSCGSPTRPDQHSSRTRWPGEPAGFVAATDQSWTTVTPERWGRRPSSRDRIVSDGTAPVSPREVLEYVYPAGFAGGTAPATHYYPLDKRKELFVGLEWKPSNPWHGHASGVNKVQFVYLAGGADVAMVMYGPNGGPYELRVMPQWPEHQGSWLTPNVSSRPVRLGEWHRIEWHLEYESRYGAGDGVVRWWVDGVLAGSYSDVRYPDDAGFVEYQLSPTWGGIGDSKGQTDYYWFDHAYISVPDAGAKASQARQTILFEEDFEDGSLGQRGWYDIAHWNEQLFITNTHVRHGAASLEIKYPAAGSTGPWLRRQFPAQDQVYTRYYRRWPSNWVWPPEAGPHDTYLFATYGRQWFTPTSTHLTVYTESGYAGAPRGRKGAIGLDVARVLQGEADRPLTSLAPPPAFQLDRWHCIETQATMNAPGRPDGRIQVWVDGVQIFDAAQLLLRDASHPTLQFDAFMFGPYYHFGVPGAQTTWLDALVVATARVGCLTTQARSRPARAPA